MKISIFLSYPQPYLQRQKTFMGSVIEYLKGRGFEPRTLGVTDYDMNEPLTAIRRLMLESNGLITIAFRRSIISKGIYKPDSDLKQNSIDLSDTWVSSPCLCYSKSRPPY